MAAKKPTRMGAANRLDADIVVAAALKVAETDGIEAISMRVVAERLGVTPMALYRHVATKEAMVKLVADAVVAEVSLPTAEPADWRAALVQGLADYRTQIQRYPGMAAVLLHGGLLPNARRIVAWHLDLLTSAGLSEEQARKAYARFHVLVLGRLTVDEAWRTRAERGPSSAEDKRVNAYLSELHGDAAFDSCLSILLDATHEEIVAAQSGGRPARRRRA